MTGEDSQKIINLAAERERRDKEAKQVAKEEAERENELNALMAQRQTDQIHFIIRAYQYITGDKISLDSIEDLKTFSGLQAEVLRDVVAIQTSKSSNDELRLIVEMLRQKHPLRSKNQ